MDITEGMTENDRFVRQIDLPAAGWLLARAGPAVEVKLGIWITNTKTRPAKPTGEQLDQLAEIGLDWR